jgi:hypothetical protein
LTFTIAFVHISTAKTNWTNSNCYWDSRVHIVKLAVVYAEEAFVGIIAPLFIQIV